MLSLRRWALLIIVLPTVVIGFLLGGYLTYKRYSELNNNLIERGIFLSEPLTLLSAHAMVSDDNEIISQALNNAHLKASPIVRSISVFLPDHQLYSSSNVHPEFDRLRMQPGRLLAQSTKVEIDENHIYIRSPIYGTEALESTLSIEKNGKYLYGYLVVELNRDQAMLSQQTSMINVTLLLTGAVLVMAFFAFIFVRYVFDPLDNITRAVKKISAGDTKVRVSKVMTGELEALRNAVNSVAKSVYIANERAEHNISEYTQELQQTVEQLEVQNIQLNMAKRDAQHANDVKSQFLANMSHELRTPLNGVLGFTRQLGKTPLNNNQRDFLDTIETSANNLLRIINDILDYSKLDAGKMELECIPFTLRDNVNEVMTLLAPSIFDKGLDIHLNIDPRTPDELLGDPVRLRQVIINLIGNAMKFTRDGFVRLDIKYLGSNQLGHHIKFTVTDSGIGIDDEGKKKLFAAFGQADTSTTRNFGGTGLGLNICKKLVEAMNGNIHFSSQFGEGSQFYFDVYLKESTSSIGSPLPTQELAGKKLLYFDTCPQAYVDIQQTLVELPELDLVTCDKETEFKAFLAERTFDMVLIGRKTAASNIGELKKLIELSAKHCKYVYTIINSISPNLKEAIIGSGARVCLSMPVNHRKLINMLAEPYQQVEMPRANQKGNYSGVRVLAVDDTEANLKLLSTLLSEMSIQADLADNGLEALRKAQKHKYDIIFMDIQMPIMDGVTACRKIRESSLNEETPVISVTAHAGAEEQKELIGSGFCGYLPKPIDEEMLNQVILENCPGCQSQMISFNEATEIVSEQIQNGKLPSYDELPEFASHSMIDWPLALSRAAGKQELAIEMFTMLISSLPKALDNINQGVESADCESLLAEVHKLHGACCYTGVPKLKDLVELIEVGLKQENCIDAVEPELLELIDKIEALISDSQDWDMHA
ncbi:MAG: two-component sensor histidine kinase BarA [Gammaproteobacteria bacterium]|nr:two-component sensor histidine kinase BarA [Gammaproteobacteria bacterium]